MGNLEHQKTESKFVIETIIRFKKDIDKIAPRIANKLIGELGEYYVLFELARQGITGEHIGNHGGYDILANEKMKIEVRTSLLKDEGVYVNKVKGISAGDVKNYGWRVKNRTKNNRKKFDVLVGVALDDKFTKPKYYIFTHEEAFKVDDVTIPRFNSVQKKIHLFENLNSLKRAKKANPEFITKYEEYINRNSNKFINKWNKII